jgi:hypothetical protein
MYPWYQSACGTKDGSNLFLVESVFPVRTKFGIAEMDVLRTLHLADLNVCPLKQYPAHCTDFCRISFSFLSGVTTLVLLALIALCGLWQPCKDPCLVLRK